MLKGLREKIGRKLLPAPPARPRFDYKGFDKIKSVAILFDASRKEDAELVKKYLHYLREYGKKVRAVGFYPDGKVPPMTYSKNEYIFFSSSELDLFMRPKTDELKSFIQEPFDLLLDLNLHRLFPLYYLATLSQARLKIGRNNGKDSVHDLMIEMEIEKGLKYFLRNLDQYLEMLSPRTDHEKH